MRTFTKLLRQTKTQNQQPLSHQVVDHVKLSRETLYAEVKESTARNRQFFFIWISFVLYVIVTTASTTDYQLLVPNSFVKLPIVGIELPLIGFFTITPLLVLILHFNVLQNLDTHAYKLTDWANTYQQETPPLSTIPSFIFNMALLDNSRPFAILTRLAAFLALYWAGPITIGILLFRFSDYQSWGYSVMQFAFFGLNLWIVIKAIHALPTAKHSTKAAYTQFTHWLLAGLSFFCAIQLLLVGVLTTPLLSERVSAEKVDTVFRTLPRSVLPVITIPSNSQPVTNFPKDMPTLMALDGAKDTQTWWEKHGHGIDLSGRNLQYADLPYIDLRKANLEIANLQSANLWDAKLQSAKLNSANLQSANLSYAKLQSAKLNSANLQSAKLNSANLQSADLFVANLQGADLSLANLQSAQLRGAKLQSADLFVANLQGADLSLANLQSAQLRGAKLQSADLSLANLQGADLSLANLQSAQLRGAKLQSADLFVANLQSANLYKANLQSANLDKANLQNTFLINVVIDSVKLSAVQVNAQTTLLAGDDLGGTLITGKEAIQSAKNNNSAIFWNDAYIKLTNIDLAHTQQLRQQWQAQGGALPSVLQTQLFDTAKTYTTTDSEMEYTDVGLFSQFNLQSGAIANNQGAIH